MSRELEAREKKLIVAAAVVFVIFIVYILVMTGGGEGRSVSAESLSRTRDQLVNQIREYNQIKAEVSRVDENIKKTPADFDLIGEVGRMGQEAGISPKGISPHDSGGNEFYDESYVNMQINDVSLKELVDFLQKVEESNAYLRVSRLNVKRKSMRQDEESLLDVNIRVTVYSAKEPVQ